MENHQQIDDINKLKENIKSAYYKVTKTEINNTPRLQKLQSIFKIK
jgi:predicted transcriptional regulator